MSKISVETMKEASKTAVALLEAAPPEVKLVLENPQFTLGLCVVLHQEVSELRKMLNLTGQEVPQGENLFAWEAGQSHQKVQAQPQAPQKATMNQTDEQRQELAPQPQQGARQQQEMQPPFQSGRGARQASAMPQQMQGSQQDQSASGFQTGREIQQPQGHQPEAVAQSMQNVNR